jgi:hypothetical protein
VTIAEFLLARINEDEAVVEKWPRDARAGIAPNGRLWQDQYGHPVWQARARVLAECEAKRRIVEEFAALTPIPYDIAEGIYGAMRHCVQVLALPYADHPDFREEWRL